MQISSCGDVAAAAAGAPTMRELSPAYHHRSMFGMPWYPYMSQQLPPPAMGDGRTAFSIVSPPISPHVEARFDPVLLSAEMRHLAGQKRPLEGTFSAPPSMATGYGSGAGHPYDAMSLHHRSLAAQRSRYHMVEEGDSM